MLSKESITSRNPRAFAFAAAIALFLGCGPGEPEKPSPAPERETSAGAPSATADSAESPSSTSTANPPEPAAKAAPLPEPAAYFGDLGRERVASPLELKPTDGQSVLLIVIDALNAKHLGVYGNERPTSPAIDALAADGLVLTGYVSNSSWTRPSFATIVTGLPKREHKMELATAKMSSEIVTLAERFQRAGYKTAAFVGNPLVRSLFGFEQGFDDYVDNDVLGKAGFPDDELFAKQARRWIERHKAEKFFVVVFFTSPHAPYRPHGEVPRFYEGLPPGSNVALPLREYKHGMPAGDLAWTVATYDNEVAYADAQVGKLTAYLKQAGLADTMSIVVTADHGEIFGEHNCFLHTYHMWDPVLRVPFVLRSPALPRGGLYDDRPFTHVDLAPTLLALAGVDPGEPALPGRSILADLRDPSANRQRVLFSQFNAHGIRRQAIRKDRYKVVHHHPVDPRVISGLNKLRNDTTPPDPSDLPSLSYRKEKYELYDLAADPGEQQDLYEERKTAAETVELLADLNETILGDESEELKIELDEETLEALKAAGYITGD